jgi:SAM-dependent methyltransferase
MVIYHYKLASAVPQQGDASYAEIAATSGLAESLCRRFIRCAIGNNIFDENPESARVFHTESSRQLALRPQFYEAVGFQLEDVAPAAFKLPKTWAKYGQEDGEQSHSAFSVENMSDKTIYDIYASEPKRGRRFGDAMQFYTQDDSWDLHHILASFDWKGVEFDRPGASVVDVGGGQGQISYFLARHSQNLRFIVQDLPHVLDVAREEVPQEVRQRVTFEAHDFFEPQVARDAAPVAFLLRHILHNWSDGYCVKILRALRPALSPGARILIIEYVLEDGPVKDLSTRFGFQLDMIMASLFTAQVRRVIDFERLLRLADSRFEIKRVGKPPGPTLHSVIEIEWDGGPR